ncbi:hypothetical protein Bca52824_056421 [Brassica carinata]|uniref:Thaumatin-like protein n=1 Tax=Brassica carinata TaxID=52824 RepID=A0A8X7QPE7_BRACI|nr:hypothetical protein Bca52824_056421 [Brassica carinata]
MNKILPLVFIIASNLFVSGKNFSDKGVTSKNITIENKCDYTVWPGISNSFNDFDTIGHALEKETRVLSSRRGLGQVRYGVERSAPQTQQENFRALRETAAPANVDLYRVNVVYGFNLPLLVVPQRSPNDKVCSRVGCDVVNLNQACPYELMVVDAEERPIACTNPCEVPDCMPSSYSESFKVPCPEATFDFSDDNYVACAGSTDYVITFCPSFSSPHESITSISCGGVDSVEHHTASSLQS